MWFGGLAMVVGYFYIGKNARFAIDKKKRRPGISQGGGSGFILRELCGVQGTGIDE
ncbi:MAG: hypothetical protein RLZZ70_832 [Candidatus Parcubacteria bacterium]|jgi:hypothetical protein